RARLTRLGILRDTGHEHLRGRVVFPVVAESGEIGTVYGRAIDDGGKHDRHLFLPGPQRGVWNPAALRSPEIILCEGMIDALTFWSAGFRHVTTGYSAKALPEELLAALVAAKVRRVLIAFDRDEAGEKGAAEVAAQLAAYGVECVRVLFPPGHDANSYAVAVTPPEKSLGVLLHSALPLGEMGKGKVSPHVAPAPSSLAAKAAAEAAPVARAPEATATPNEAAKEEKPAANNAAALPPVPVAAVNANGVVVAKNDAEEILLVIDERAYRVRGLAKNTGFESLKVTLRAACGERWHLDQVDLCVARQRENFVAAAAVETNLRPELLKRDLGKILGKLE
ncbi:MAG: toprim domain-containing protein, partial [Opitutaceae bacterium]